MTDRSSARSDDQETDPRAEEALWQIAEAEAILAELRARLAPYAAAEGDPRHLTAEERLEVVEAKADRIEAKLERLAMIMETVGDVQAKTLRSAGDVPVENLDDN